MFTAIAFASASLTTYAAGGNKQKGSSAAPDLWRQADQADLPTRGRRLLTPDKYLVFSLNGKALAKLMDEMPMEFTSAPAPESTIMEVPMPDGTLSRFRIEDSPVLAPHLAADFPTWKTFQGFGIDDPSATARFDWTTAGFHGYIFTDNGTIYIDPFQENDTDNYLVYYKHEYGASAGGNFSCKTEESIASMISPEDLNGPTSPTFAFGASIRTYRLAVATTGEWARSNTASTDPQTVRTAALAALTTSVNRLDGIYRREIAVSLQLVNPPITDNAKNIIFDNPTTDPYDNTDSSNPPNDQLAINQTTIDARVGAANYDVGHLYGTGGGGVASSPSACSAAKAQGYSARGGTPGDPFTVDYVAHEIGHQFGGSHTYNNRDNGGACTTRSTNNAFEVGSGSTIMSYVGICNIRNLQQYVDTGIPMFHIRSLTQMVGDIQNPENSGSCGTPSGTNNIPTVNPGASFTIPRLTPFTLTATGTDADAGDVPNLLYSWEEYDLAPSGSGELGTPALTYDVDTDGILRPLFRAYSPVASPSRTFPSMAFILNPANNIPAGSNNPPLTYQGTHPTAAPGATCQGGNDCVIGESLPSAARTMNFRVAVRDRRGGIADAGMTVTTAANTGPFQVTVQNTAPLAWEAASTQTITWDVAGTATAPINAANVKISLSTDGGLTFPTTLLASTPNDGTEPVTIPNTPTTQARIKVEAVGNIFFDINNANFTISTGPGVIVGDTRAVERPQPGDKASSPVTSDVFTITLSAPSTQTVTVRVSTNGITATEGVDFTAVDDFDVVFPPNTVSQTVSVPLIEDDVYEGDETFALDVTAVTNAAVIDGEGIGTIIENDPIPGPFEGDINRAVLGVPWFGDGDVNVADTIQYQRFLRGADCPGRSPSTEQQRLDTGPRNVLGDGSLGASDGTAIDAYARHDGSTDFNPNVAGWQPTPAGGPTTISNLGCTPVSAPEKAAKTTPESKAAASARIVRVVSRSGNRGSDITVDIEMAAQGNEAGTQFGLHFDPAVLSISDVSGVNVNPDISRGANVPAGATLNVNAGDAANGNIGIVENFNGAISSPAVIESGRNRIARVQSIVRVKFHVLDGAATGTSRITFDDSVINGVTSDANGMALSANYDQSGSVSVTASRGVTVSGRVTSSDGRGIRNATVTIIDGDGMARTSTTSSFGYYTFDDVTAATYWMSVASRQYRFASRTIEVGDTLTDVNFTGLE